MTSAQFERWRQLPKKKFKVTYRMNPRYGGHVIYPVVDAPNKTMARMQVMGEYNPGRVLNIREV